jgi:hypothetical protein
VVPDGDTPAGDDAPPAVVDDVPTTLPPDELPGDDTGDDTDVDTDDDGDQLAALVLSDFISLDRRAISVGDDLVIEGRISGDCSAVGIVVDGVDTGSVPVEADGSFRAVAATADLAVGEHDGSVRCLDGGAPVPFDFVVSRRSDRNGLSPGTMLVTLLLFLVITSVLVVSLPQPQAAGRRRSEKEGSSP